MPGMIGLTTESTFLRKFLLLTSKDVLPSILAVNIREIKTPILPRNHKARITNTELTKQNVIVTLQLNYVKLSHNLTF